MSESNSSPSLVLQFRNPETHRLLREMSETMGVSMSELAEVAIQQELAAVRGNLDSRLSRIVDRLRTFPGEHPVRAAADFASRESVIEDPIRARRVDAEDAHGIGAAFARRMERG